MQKFSRAKSIFGGPLSTRELCKAAAQNGKCSFPAKTQTSTASMKVPQRTLNSKPSNVRKQRPMPFPPQSRALSRTTPPSAKIIPPKTKARPPAAPPGVKKSPQRRRPTKETVSVKNGVKRKVEMDVSCKEKPTKTRRVVSGGGLFNRMRREAGTNNQMRVTQSRIGTFSSTRQRPEEEVDEFIDDRETNEDWRSELRKVTNYDPAKFKDDGRDDKSMEVGLRQCWREEQRTSRLGRLEDQKELEREAKRRKCKNR